MTARTPPTSQKITFAEMRSAGRSRPSDLLLGLQVQPFDRDQRRPLARSCSAERHRAPVHLPSVRPARR